MCSAHTTKQKGSAIGPLGAGTGLGASTPPRGGQRHWELPKIQCEQAITNSAFLKSWLIFRKYSATPDIRTCVFGPRVSRVEVAGVNGVFESLGLTSRRLKLKKIFPNETRPAW